VPLDPGAAPRLYIFDTYRNLVEQLRTAPIQKEGQDAGEAVDSAWEAVPGHAHASARYGAMGRVRPSPEPQEDEETDAREAAALRMLAQIDAERESDYLEV